MYVQSLKISGFASFREVIWAPQRLNVLIGPNGSGKSNLLRVLDLIRASAEGELRPFILSRGGLPRLLWQGSAKLERQVGDARFRQHFAVHETEAWLLSDPAIFPPAIRSRVATDRPESVNFHEPPSKLMVRAYRANGRKYKKTIDGPALLQKLDPNRAYERCPHFRALLEDMLSLAKAAGV